MIHILEALSPTDGKTEVNKTELLTLFKKTLKEPLYLKIINRYNLQHLEKNEETMCLDDVRAILIGLITNTTPQDLEEKDLYQFLTSFRKKTYEMAQRHRKPLAQHMDEKVLTKKNPITGFILWVCKKIVDLVIKTQDIKDVLGGVRINKAFEEDIKTAATLDYARTYKMDYSENNKKKGIGSTEMAHAISNKTQREKIASGLYLASDLAYRKLNHGSVLPILDMDGKERLYSVHNIVRKGLVCSALVPYDRDSPSEHRSPLDIKVIFRGTHNLRSASIDLESTGAGSKTMQDNRIKLLDEVNNLVENLQSSHPTQKVSLSIHGHSLGGAFAERFTSEINQAIYFTQTHGKAPPQDAPIDVQERILRNNEEMKDKSYTALSALTSISLTSANSARLSKKEAHIGDSFLTLTQKPHDLNYFQAKGDWISQAGDRSLGSSLTTKNDKLSISMLSKKTGYGGITAMHPILGHCDHPLMRYHDKRSHVPTFKYYDKTAPAELKQKLSSGKLIPKHLQRMYANIPKVFSTNIKYYEVETVREKTERKKRKF